MKQRVPLKQRVPRRILRKILTQLKHIGDGAEKIDDKICMIYNTVINIKIELENLQSFIREENFSPLLSQRVGPLVAKAGDTEDSMELIMNMLNGIRMDLDFLQVDLKRINFKKKSSLELQKIADKEYDKALGIR